MLFYWVNGNQFVSGNITFPELITRAVSLIMDLNVDGEFCVRFGKSKAELDAMGLGGKTWVECVLWHVSEDEQQRHDYLPDALEHHRRIASRMATHLQLTCDNVARFAWYLGAMISPSPEQARANARLAQQHLLRTKPEHRTPLESLIMSDDVFMNLLGMYCDIDPAVLLWRNSGKYEHVYKFIVVRFHSQPDHVLHCESIHAQWKWVEEVKRGIKFKLLSAILNLQALIANCGGLADPDPNKQQ